MMRPSPDRRPLPPADLAVLRDPAFIASAAAGRRASFAHGVQGYTDDRIADGVGWETFDVSQVRCPVVVLHGASDSIVPVGQAHHLASIVPGAEARIFHELGHFSIMREIVPALTSLRSDG